MWTVYCPPRCALSLPTTAASRTECSSVDNDRVKKPLTRAGMKTDAVNCAVDRGQPAEAEEEEVARTVHRPNRA